MNIKFVYPWVIYCFWIIPLIYFWWFALNKHSRDRLQKFASGKMLKKLLPQMNNRRFYWQSSLICLGMVFALLALARPQWGSKEQVIYQRGRDVMICLDVSRSMLAADVRPNRLERAKSDLLDLIYSLNGDRAGLIAFRHRANVVCPLTIDYSYLRQALLNVSPASAPRGETDIGAAIKKALESFDDEDPSHKAIMLVSDGEDLTGKAIEMAQLAKKRGIPIFTVGFGSRKGSMIPDSENPKLKLKYDGKEVVSKLQHATLDKIASISGGAYIPVETASLTKTTLGDLYRDRLRGIAAEDKEETVKRTYIERYQIFLLPAFICFVLAAFMVRGRLARKKPMPKLKQLAVFALLGVSIQGLFAQGPSQHPIPVAPERPFTFETNAVSAIDTNSVQDVADDVEIKGRARPVARSAQSLYNSGDFVQAADYYEHAGQSAETLEEKDIYTYNAGVAAYKAGDFSDAALHFSAVSDDSIAVDKTRLYEALGASYYNNADIGTNTSAAAFSQRQTAMTQAAEAFKMAMRNSPDNYDNAKNFAVVMAKIPDVRKKAKIAALMEQYKDDQPGLLVDTIWENQKNLITQLEEALTNVNASVIQQMEAVADAQMTNADLIVPLRAKINQTQGQQTEQESQALQVLNQLLDSTQDKMYEAATKMDDLDKDSWRTAKIAESGIYNTWKTLAPFTKILSEAISQQTNNIIHTTDHMADKELLTKDVLPVQQEVSSLTQLFEGKFTNSVPVGGTQQQGMPIQNNSQGIQMPMTEAGGADPHQQQGIDAETRAKILDLTQQAKEVQELCLQNMYASDYSLALNNEHKSYKILKEIEELLPKNQNQQNQNQENQQKQKNQQNQQQNQQKQEQKQQQKQEQKQQQNQNQQKQQQEKQSETQPQQEEHKELSEDQIKQLLQKALQREEEHKEEKMRQNETIPLSPYEKDW